MNREVATGKPLVKLIVKGPVVDLPAGTVTVISGGCHVVPPAWPEPFIAVQVAPGAAATQFHPHIGTMLPSWRVVDWLVAVRLTD
jgi:hypothetical protein